MPNLSRTVSTPAALLWLSLAMPAVGQAPQGGQPAAPPPGVVFVDAVRFDTLPEPKTFVGTIMPLRKSVVGSAAPGRVEEYLVNEGDFVTKGTPIAHLRRGIIGAEKRAAEAELEVRRAALAEMESSVQDEVVQAKAMLAIAEANSQFRAAKLERARQLNNAITREALEEEVSMSAQANANVLHAQAVLRLLTGNSWIQKREQMRARVAVQEAEVERLSEQFDRHTMIAPFDGWVTKEFTEIGHWMMQGDPAAEIAELSSVDIEIAVVEDYVTRLTLGLSGRVEVNAIRDPVGLGTIVAINPQADARARTFPVKVRVPNVMVKQEPRLKAGMFARVTLHVGDVNKVQPLVPKDAINIGGQTPLVFVVHNAGGKSTVQPVPVQLGAANGQWISVLSDGLKEGDLIVVEGNERLRPGQEVNAEKIELDYP